MKSNKNIDEFGIGDFLTFAPLVNATGKSIVEFCEINMPIIENILLADMTDEEHKKHCIDVSKLSKAEKAGYKRVLNYLDGKEYASIVEPENLSQDQLRNRDFILGYSKGRKELGKKSIGDESKGTSI